MKGKLLASFIAVILLVLPSFSFAYMDDTHAYFITKLCDDNSFIKHPSIVNMCEHRDAAIAGAVMPDISVFYYLEKFPNKYTATHTKSFCTAIRGNAITDRERAFAQGACLGHLIADSYAHNIFVPTTIRKTGLTNLMVHVFAEEKVNDYLIARNPFMPSLLDENLRNWKEFVPLMTKTLENKESWRNTQVEPKMQALVNEITCSNLGPETDSCNPASFGLAYKTMLAVPWYMYVFAGLILIFNLFLLIKLFTFLRQWNWFAYLTALLTIFWIALIVFAIVFLSQGELFAQFEKLSAPITAILPTPDIAVSVQETYNLIKQYAMDPDYFWQQQLVNGVPVDIVKPPHGHGSLSAANASTAPGRVLLLIFLIGAILLLVYFHFTGRIRFWDWFKRKKFRA